MEKEFVPYEQALALKQLGFDEPCFAYFYHHQEYKILFDNPNQARDYNSIKIDVGSIFDHDEERVKKGLESLGDSVSRMTSIPLYQQVFRWFREKYQIDSWIYPNLNGLYSVSNVRRGVGLGKVSEYQTYEEAELECLKKLIEIVKEK
jgi:hypothetical protein